MKSSLQISDPLNLAAADAIRKSADALLSRQTSEGFWWADLRADSTLESDYL
jgi:squalene-hopene/tetraprenyl-beta-curcumene cyclase